MKYCQYHWMTLHLENASWPNADANFGNAHCAAAGLFSTADGQLSIALYEIYLTAEPVCRLTVSAAFR
jgi:hypothetical protein